MTKKLKKRYEAHDSNFRTKERKKEVYCYWEIYAGEKYRKQILKI